MGKVALYEYRYVYVSSWRLGRAEAKLTSAISLNRTATAFSSNPSIRCPWRGLVVGRIKTSSELSRNFHSCVTRWQGGRRSRLNLQSSTPYSLMCVFVPGDLRVEICLRFIAKIYSIRRSCKMGSQQCILTKAQSEHGYPHSSGNHWWFIISHRLGWSR